MLRDHEWNDMDIKIFRVLYRLRKKGVIYYQKEEGEYVEHWGVFNLNFKPAPYVTYENGEFRFYPDPHAGHKPVDNPFTMLELFAEACPAFEKLLYTIEL
jgi:hypothetical protein